MRARGADARGSLACPSTKTYIRGPSSADRLEAGIFDNRVLHVGHFSIVFEKMASADARHGGRAFHIDAPMDDAVASTPG